jgi:hypothetical protein
VFTHAASGKILRNDLPLKKGIGHLTLMTYAEQVGRKKGRVEGLTIEINQSGAR